MTFSQSTDLLNARFKLSGITFYQKTGSVVAEWSKALYFLEKILQKIFDKLNF